MKWTRRAVTRNDRGAQWVRRERLGLVGVPLVLLPLVPLPTGAEEAVSLALRLRPGDRFRQTVTMREAQSFILVNTPSVDPTKIAEHEFVMTGRIEAGGGAGTVDVQMTYDRYAVVLKDAKRTLRYDTGEARPPTDPESLRLGETVKRMVGKVLVLNIDSAGQVIGVRTPEGPSAGSGPGGGLLGNPLGGLPGLLPKTPVKPGDRWKNEVALDVPAPAPGAARSAPPERISLRLTTESELKAVEGSGSARAALIASRLVVAPKTPEGVPAGVSTPPWIVYGDGTIASRYDFALGFVSSARGVLSLVVQPGSEATARGLKKIMIRQELVIVNEALGSEGAGGK